MVGKSKFAALALHPLQSPTDFTKEEKEYGIHVAEPGVSPTADIARVMRRVRRVIHS